MELQFNSETIKDLFNSWKGILGNHISEVIQVGDFILSSGKKSNFYVNCKEKILKRSVMEAISKCILYGCSDLLNYWNVAGVTSGADPIVCGCVAFNGNNGLLIRKERKGYGIKNTIEGDVVSGDYALIVDDVLTTGGSLRHAYKTLKEHEITPVGIMVIVDRQENDSVNQLEKDLKIPVYSILTKDELIKYKEG